MYQKQIPEKSIRFQVYLHSRYVFPGEGICGVTDEQTGFTDGTANKGAIVSYNDVATLSTVSSDFSARPDKIGELRHEDT